MPSHPQIGPQEIFRFSMTSLKEPHGVEWHYGLGYWIYIVVDSL